MKKREQDGQAKVIGLVSTLAFHALLLLVIVLMSFRVKTTTPSEVVIEVHFEDEAIPKPVPEKPIEEPNLEEAAAPSRVTDPQIKPAASEPKTVPSQQTTASAPASLDNKGDVEKNNEPKPINPRSLYSSRDVGEQAADNTGKVDERALYEGRVEGSSDYSAGSSPDNGPSFSLTGRTTVGGLPLPVYTENTAGNVVVSITVDQQGKVIEAKPGARGTTVQDSKLWEAARVAALKARFNVDSKAAVVQTGTITYIFRLE